MLRSARRAATLAPLLALPLLLAPAADARAQYTEAQPGVRVRVEAPGVVAGRYAGTVLTREAGSIRIAETNGTPIDVPLARITSLEISRGKSRLAGLGRGALIGAGVGGALGLLAIAVDDNDSFGYTYDVNGYRSTYSDGEVVLSSIIGGAFWGGIIGVFIPKERWDRFDVAPRTGLDGRGRMQLGMRVGF